MPKEDISQCGVCSDSLVLLTARLSDSHAFPAYFLALRADPTAAEEFADQDTSAPPHPSAFFPSAVIQSQLHEPVRQLGSVSVLNDSMSELSKIG